MNAIYGKKVILLIDEYDVPLAKASEKDTAENGYYSKMLDVIKGIMSTALKDNEFLQFAVITGCLRIAKESIFTGANNFAAYSVIFSILGCKQGSPPIITILLHFNSLNWSIIEYQSIKVKEFAREM